MKHLDLFSGIGGFALAASWVWGAEHEIVSFVEIDEFCRKVLHRHWPETPIISDIRDVTYERIFPITSSDGQHSPKLQEFQENNGTTQARPTNDAETSRHSSLEKMARGARDERILADTEPTRRNRTRHSKVSKREFSHNEFGVSSQKPTKTKRQTKTNSTIDLLTGGFPCQPFSVAGKQRSQEDDRFLWPEMLRVIREFRPTWIIGENVAGIINLALDQVLSDLEASGYEVQSFIIPACAVNSAPHRRDRVWIVAHTRTNLSGAGYRKIKEKNGTIQSRRKNNRRHEQLGLSSQDVADTEKQGLERGIRNEQGKTISRFGQNSVAGKQSNWLPQSGLGMSHDGLSRWMARHCGYRWDDQSWDTIPRVATGVKDRVNKLKALGNAIVPQVVVPIMQAIKEIDQREPI